MMIELPLLEAIGLIAGVIMLGFVIGTILSAIFFGGGNDFDRWD